jgi:DNA polymerase-3 subunit gamma/tau
MTVGEEVVAMSMYKALYRAYRPDTFEQIVGQQHIVTTLKNTIAGQKIGHAYLFHGPRGTGKTTIAKIFAAAVNCEASLDEARPCHMCKNCQLIDNGETSDIIELDAASNSGVDEIRQIREFVRYAPSHLPYKVYIIDEVHMLSTAAFNALLKTLEEPPAHVIFILATTESHKIPATIISRTQRFDFKKVSVADMKQGIAPILAQEDIVMSEAALDYLVDYADGGMRDALSVLDQVRMYAKAQIELQDLHDVIGSVGPDVYLALMNAVMAQDKQTIMTRLATLIASGKNVQLFIEGFLRYLLHEVETSMQQSSDSGLSTQALLDMLEQMNQLAGQMRTAFSPQIALQAGFLALTQCGEERMIIDAPVSAQHVRERVQKTVPEAGARAEEMVQREQRDEQMRTQDEQGEARASDATLRETNLGEQGQSMPRYSENAQTKIDTVAPLSTTDVLDLYNADNFVPPGEDTGALETGGTADEAALSSDTADYLMPELAPRLQDARSGKAEEAIHARLARVMEQGIEKIKVPASSEEARVEASDGKDAQATHSVENTEAKQPLVAQQASAKDVASDEAQAERAAARLEREQFLLSQAMVQVVLDQSANMLEDMKHHWQRLKFDPNNQTVVMLLDMEPKIATRETLVLSSTNTALTNQFQIEQHKYEAEAFLSTLMGATYRIVVIDDATWTRTREQFSRDWKANKVTKEKLHMLTAEIEALDAALAVSAEGVGEHVHGAAPLAEQKEADEPIVKAAVDLFGADIVEVK